MADVRELLRAERANRRITHPHAFYSKDGKLMCTLCGKLVKSEAQWQSHLHSTQHVLRSQQPHEGEETKISVTKKRKADSPAREDEGEERKRARSDHHQAAEEDDARVAKAVRFDLEPEVAEAEGILDTQRTAPPQAEDVVDEAELAAFERELADLEATTATSTSAQINSALNAEATISAAPMTAEELAAQAREEQSTQRGRRDAELEAEREDAARLLEDEMDEMEGLEERVRKLRERREALRSAKSPDGDDEAADLLSNGVDEREAAGEADQDDDDDDDDYDDDQWRFAGS